MVRCLAVLAVLLVACGRDAAEKACLAGDADACDLLSARYATRTADLCAKPGAAAAACTRSFAAHSAVPLDLPAPPPDPAAAPKMLKVVLTADGRMLVDGAPIDEDALRAKAASIGHDGRAVINADSAAPHGRVIHVLDILKQAGVTKIAFGVSPTLDAGPR
jgi:biopolymer transport protein ExbD